MKESKLILLDKIKDLSDLIENEDSPLEGNFEEALEEVASLIEESLSYWV